jgi:hypothetical protein
MKQSANLRRLIVEFVHPGQEFLPPAQPKCRAIWDDDLIMLKLSFAGRRQRLTTRIAGGFAGLDRACQADRAWHRIDGLDCPSRPEYGMAETKPLSGAGFFHQMSSSVNGAGIARNRRFSAQNRSATMGYQRQLVRMSAPQVHRV